MGGGWLCLNEKQLAHARMESLGTPGPPSVIYTCREAEWDAQRSHFDTNHLNTIVWDPADLPDAAARLTAMIRATLPGEAKAE